MASQAPNSNPSAAPCIPYQPDSVSGQAQLAHSWDQAAAAYEGYFVPRFAPWVRDAIAALPADLPPGDLVVPCCGTGPELLSLSARFPGRAILGIDMSAGMLACAAERTQHMPQVRLRVADASDTREWPACAAVISLFGLQQIADPAGALRSWVEALVPGGVLSVIFWPAIIEEDGPFAWLRTALMRQLTLPSPVWESELADSIALAGGRLHDDGEIVHAMKHDSAAECFVAFLASGPGRMLADRHGAAWVEQLRHEFMSVASEGPIAHMPAARHLVARR